LVWPDLGLVQRTITLEASTPTITQPMSFCFVIVLADQNISLSRHDALQWQIIISCLFFFINAVCSQWKQNLPILIVTGIQTLICRKIIFHTPVAKSSFTFISQNHLSHSGHKIIFHTPVTKSHFTFLSQNHFYSCNYLLSKWNHFSRRHSGKIKFFIITHPDFSSSSGISE
jgi:hypothetical protein